MSDTAIVDGIEQPLTAGMSEHLASGVPDAAMPGGTLLVMSSRAFMARFTREEREAIFAAALTNSRVLQGLTILTSGEVDLADPLTRVGLDYIVGHGLLRPSRVAELLTP